jgi:phospholipase A-2-activating protein
MFEAGEYDHVFDVELGDGVMRKLPFNNGGNHLESAEKFCMREGINRSQVEQIVQFLRQHALSYKTRDFDKQELKNANVKSGKNKPSSIPMTVQIFFDAINVDGPKKKLMTFEDEFSKLTYPVQFHDLCKILAAGVKYDTPDIGEQQHRTMQQLLDFPADKAFPCIDLYRMYLMHPTSSQEFVKSDFGAGQVTIMLKFLKNKNAPKACHMLALRSICNFFKNQSSNHVAILQRSSIFDAIAPFMNSEDKNTRQACSTVFLK